MKPLISMRAALDDPHLFGPMLAGESWLAWRVLLIALFGEELNIEERRIFEALTNRAREPLQIVECFLGIVGRRGGKTRAMSIAAAFIAALCDHSANVVPGEVPLVLVLAQNQRQASIMFSYVVAVFEQCPMLAAMIVNRTSDSLSLSNGVAIEVRAASFRGLRGVTCIAVLADEICFWANAEGSANADSDIIAAVRPALATTNGPLILISSPYSKRGEAFTLWQRHFGPQGDPLILVAQGASRDFNPSLPQRVVDRAMEADAASASAEYLGQWRSDISAFVAREAVERCVTPSCYERPRVPGVIYSAFCDPSGGSADSMTLAIGHREGETVVLDCIREVKPPFSPEAVVVEFASILRSYGVARVSGDRYGGEWPREQFRKNGVDYEPSEKPKSALFQEVLPLLNAGKVDLLDHDKLVAQFCNLERRTARGGKDSIDHAPGGHDDVANAVAGALLLAAADASSLARLGDFLIEGSAAPLPEFPRRIGASIVCGNRGAHAGLGGAAIFSVLPANSPFRVVLVDIISGDFGAPFLAEVYLRLQKWSDRLKPHLGYLAVADDEIARAYSNVMDGVRMKEMSEGRLDPRAQPCGRYRPELLCRANLAATAAAIISSGGCKIGADLLAESSRRPIGSLLDF
ncbi:MAG: hypothetical protein ACLPSW_13965 [Roseiarcus sp.]